MNKSFRISLTNIDTKTGVHRCWHGVSPTPWNTEKLGRHIPASSCHPKNPIKLMNTHPSPPPGNSKEKETRGWAQILEIVQQDPRDKILHHSRSPFSTPPPTATTWTWIPTSCQRVRGITAAMSIHEVHKTHRERGERSWRSLFQWFTYDPMEQPISKTAEASNLYVFRGGDAVGSPWKQNKV